MLLQLRAYLSHGHQRGLAAAGLLDRVVTYHHFEERMHRIATQLTAALACRETLVEMGFENLPNDMDLLPLVDMLSNRNILNRREVNILRDINRMAVEAKHRLDFGSRL